MRVGVRDVFVMTVTKMPGEDGSGEGTTCFHRMSLWATLERGQSSPPRRPLRESCAEAAMKTRPS